MPKLATVIALALLLLGGAALVAPAEAEAQYRQFTGRIDKINKRKFIVDNRKGDKVPFVRVDATSVEGEGKQSYDDLKKGDWVTVDWKFIDKPRKAYKILVIPPREDDDD